MCQNIYARFRCSDMHNEIEGNDGLKLKHIARCDIARQSPTGAACPPAQREDVHIMQEDKPEENCPECRGETPSETP
jgi:hypothetical protein